MNKRDLIRYAEKNGWELEAEKNYQDRWVAKKPTGHVLTAVSLEAMKKMIDTYSK